MGDPGTCGYVGPSGAIAFKGTELRAPALSYQRGLLRSQVSHFDQVLNLTFLNPITFTDPIWVLVFPERR